jgi:hypothetical protein
MIARLSRAGPTVAFPPRVPRWGGRRDCSGSPGLRVISARHLPRNSAGRRIRAAPGVRKRIRNAPPGPPRTPPSFPDRRGRKRGHSSAELRMFHPALQDDREAVNRGLPPHSTLCNGITTFTVDSWRNPPRGTSAAGRLDPAGGKGYSGPRPAHRRSLRSSAPAGPPTLTATQDGRHGRLPASRPQRLLPLPPGRQALPGHLPARDMAGPATCRASASSPGPPLPF